MHNSRRRKIEWSTAPHPKCGKRGEKKAVRPPKQGAQLTGGKTTRTPAKKGEERLKPHGDEA